MAASNQESPVSSDSETHQKARKKRDKKKKDKDDSKQHDEDHSEGTQSKKDKRKLIKDPTHAKYELMYDMLNGIRTTVGKISAEQGREVETEDFKTKNKLSFNRTGGSRVTVATKKYDFKFKDYMPIIFKKLRERFGLDAADYMISLTSEYILMEMSTNSKSGSDFFFSSDMRFIIKTLTKAESKFLRQILPDYYAHVCQHRNTLLTRFYGLHRVKGYKGTKTHFVIMGNLFPPNIDLNETYDLKGSYVGRQTKDESRKKGCVMKDLDFDRDLNLGPLKARALMDQITLDSQFLEDHNIMDYSLLIGIHDPRVSSRPARSRGLSVFYQTEENELANIEAITPTSPQASSTTPLASARVKQFDSSYRLPSQPHPEQLQSVFYQDNGGFRATDQSNRRDNHGELYFVSIIDFLQPYNATKKFEHAFKSIKHDKNGISAVEPHFYGKRFRNFMSRVLGNPSLADQRLEKLEAPMRTSKDRRRQLHNHKEDSDEEGLPHRTAEKVRFVDVVDEAVETHLSPAKESGDVADDERVDSLDVTIEIDDDKNKEEEEKKEKEKAKDEKEEGKEEKEEVKEEKEEEKEEKKEKEEVKEEKKEMEEEKKDMKEVAEEKGEEKMNDKEEGKDATFSESSSSRKPSPVILTEATEP
eukprot:TRINITY_DN41574_c0_g1_i1.p1 TRINITY_DN41574_c0_g1~~TRINITY_DN41574_c0_g1_i1.p1  ORF type:complete len:644 (+),score=184.52 TRINITY_DN41574_c0_g1_i1:142-2073(+)